MFPMWTFLDAFSISWDHASCWERNNERGAMAQSRDSEGLEERWTPLSMTVLCSSIRRH
jgi:hypothetical protein